ncbi:MAG TPA: hypothetical protein G4O11_09895 [Anaerolineae bacterium]|nr:hypothetical protein [Anaerolineae bacterium]
MSLKILPKRGLSDWVSRLITEYRVVGPKLMKDQYIFGDIHSADDLALDYSTTILPPKKILLPQRETLIQFDTASSSQPIEPFIETQATIILGVHTCDMHAISLLDQIFLEGFPDQHYLARRKNITLVSIECLRSCSEHSFCKSMGTLSVPETFDLHLTDLGNSYALETGSKKGSALLWSMSAVRDPTNGDYRQLQKVMSEKWQSFNYRLVFDITELPSLLALSYDNTLWDEIGDRCLGCGACTIVCPTCYCFNVIDEVDFSLHRGARSRVWDSCQLDRFATVAGGHNFRVNRSDRQRHRFFRKGKYQMEAYGLVGCVGCGRCAQSCLVHISPVEVFNELYRRQSPITSLEQEVTT